jgi:hypothetical protein
MAKVTGPLLSLSASGTLGGILHYQPTAKGANVKRPWVQPPGTSRAQLQQQCGYAVAAQVYRVQKATVDATWAEEAERKRITPFNAYLSAFLKHWQAGAIVLANGIIRYSAVTDASVGWGYSQSGTTLTVVQPNIRSGLVVARWIKWRIGAFPDSNVGNSQKCTGLALKYELKNVLPSTNYRFRSCIITTTNLWYASGGGQFNTSA